MSVRTTLEERTWSPSVRWTWRRLTSDSPRLVLVVLASAALAWFAMVFLHGGDGASIVDHHRLGSTETHQGTVLDAPAHQHAAHEHSGDHHGDTTTVTSGLARSALLVLGGWAVMVLAMMLPPALPMLSVVERLVSRRPHPRLLLLAGTATFVAAWTVVGAAMIAGDALLHRLTEGWGLTWHVDALVPGAIVLGAGVFQLTPLKRSCLRACRSPRSFALAHWRRRRAALTEVMTVTGAYALACIGCCWALMAISFAVGVAALPVMVALAVFMAAERLSPWGRRLSRPTGVALILLGAGIAVEPFVAGVAG